MRLLFVLIGIRNSPPKYWIFVYISLATFNRLLLFGLFLISGKIAVFAQKCMTVIYAIIETKIYADICIPLIRSPQPDYKFLTLIGFLILSNITYRF